jgi:hypothetical protein
MLNNVDALEQKYNLLKDQIAKVYKNNWRWETIFEIKKRWWFKKFRK